MKCLRLLLPFVFAFVFFGATLATDHLTCKEIVDRLLDSIQHINTQEYNLKSIERVNGGLHFAESSIKINEVPKKIYFISRIKGVEVLWIDGKNNGNAVVRSRSLPLINLDLDPYGSLMRKDQHHTIFDLGFKYIGKTIASIALKSPTEFNKHFAYAGIIKWNNTDCYQLLMTYPEYKYIEYITQENETVTTISKKWNTSDYKIRYKNNLSSYFGIIKKGKKLLIPTPYANRAIVYVDKKNFMPINLKVYDEEGLYEAYEFFNIVINKHFADDEFNKNFKSYGFN